MNEHFNWEPINYIFHVQSSEDFYNQLRAFEAKHYEENVDVDDTSLAQEMLQAIGIKTK